MLLKSQILGYFSSNFPKNHKSYSDMEKANILKIRTHDAIVGVLYLISAGLTFYTGNLAFLWIAVGVGALQIISPVTKFCPVYTLLNQLMPKSDPIQNGK